MSKPMSVIALNVAFNEDLNRLETIKEPKRNGSFIFPDK